MPFAKRLWRLKAGPDDENRLIELAQLEMRVKLVPFMAATGLVVAAAIFCTFYDALWFNVGHLSIFSVFVSYLYLYIIYKLWHREARISAVVTKYKWLFCSAQFVIGSSWGWFIAAGLPVASPDERAVLFALAIALMSTPAFYGPREYALSLWAPVSIGATVGIALTPGNLLVLPTLIGLLSYAVLTFTTILRVDERTKATERQRLEAKRQSDTIALLMREFQEDASDWLWETDSELRIIRPSARFIAATEESTEKLAGRSLLDLISDHPPRVEWPPAAGNPQNAFKGCLLSREAFRDRRTLVVVHGRVRWWLMSGRPTYDEYGRFLGYRGIASDITQTHHAEQEIRFLATHDPLTKLGNRANFDKALSDACSPPAHQDAALICLDLDHFKYVNDTHGHKVGDALLVTVAQRIRACTRSQDRVFRLGGDEFAVLLSQTNSIEAAGVARRIKAKLSVPFSLAGVDATIGASIGIAMLCDYPVSPSAAHHQADLALYAAKATGRGAVSFADPPTCFPPTASGDIGSDLLTILDENDIIVEYQPIIELASHRTRYFEALVRWRHPTRGLLYPDEFIARAEDNGSISRIGWIVLEHGLLALQQLPNEVSIAINISPVQLHDIELVAKLEKRIRASGVDPSRLIFEITEKMQIERRHVVDAFFKNMQTLGCRISLDDFGSGYSSIKSIFEFPFDKIKIDRSLVSEALGDARKFEVLEGVRDLAVRIGASITIEGIETAAEADFLRTAGFEEGQGYYFGRPMPPSALGWNVNSHLQAQPLDSD